MFTPTELINWMFLALGAALVAALGGCSPQPAQFSPTESRRETRINLVRMVHEVSFPSGQDGLSETEAAKLDVFLRRDQVGYGDRVFVVADASPRAGGTGLAERRSARVAAELRRYGLNATTMGADAPDAPPPGKLAVVIARYSVTPPPCGDWSKTAFDDNTNTVGSNWGCANAHNLGLMVADPSDLIGGRNPGPADGAQAVLGIQRFRQGKVTPLEGTQGGAQQPSIQLLPPAGGASGGAAP